MTFGRHRAASLVALALAASLARPAGAAVDAPASAATTLPGGAWELSLVAGHDFALDELWLWPGLAVGLTDRLQLRILDAPTLTYRFGDPAGQELLLHAGVGWIAGNSAGQFGAAPELGATARWAVAPGLALLAGVGAGTSLWSQGFEDRDEPRQESLGELTWSAEAGATVRLSERFSLWPGIAFRQATSTLEDAETVVELGSAFEAGRARRPLIRFQAAGSLALDGYAHLRYFPQRDDVPLATLGGGVTWTF